MRLLLLAAQSVDGFITRHDQPGSGFASAEDQTHLQRTLAACDCSIMGATSYREVRDQVRANAAVPRLRVVMTRSPDAFTADAIPDRLEFTAATPAAVAESLRQRGFQQCVLLGGAQIYTLFLEAGLVDELWLTVEPRLFGQGIKLINRPAEHRLRLLATEHLSPDTLLLKYAGPRAP